MERLVGHPAGLVEICGFIPAAGRLKMAMLLHLLGGDVLLHGLEPLIPGDGPTDAGLGDRFDFFSKPGVADEGKRALPFVVYGRGIHVIIKSQ